MKPVALCINLLDQKRTNDSQIGSYEEWLKENNIPYEKVSCYHYDIIKDLDKYSALIWHYGNFVNADLMEAQHILDIAEAKGLKVYPDHNTGWHFDDKIAEMYAFQQVNAPIPQSWVFYELEKCLEWLKNGARYPLVAKLRRGSGSNNVKLLKNQNEAAAYAKRMFSKGYSPAQSLAYKAYSKIQSTHDWKTFVNRFKKIPNFLKARKFGKGMPVEKGYCYFQKFIPNDSYDLKIAVVGDKLSFLSRSTRKGDFRASGSGAFCYDRNLISPQIIDTAFQTKDALNMQCVGFDYVVDNQTGEGMIIEMCHGFDREAIYGAGGWFDRKREWHDEPINVDYEIMEELLLK